MVKTHTGKVEVTTALGKIRKNVGLYRSEKAWVVSAGETYNPETGLRNGGTVRTSVLLLDTIRALPGKCTPGPG
ncbi:TPA: hypothetical protein ACWV7G_001490 [Salmonella enterica subsp. enterica serovar Muenchen]|nr:hypothetical protein [Salmonella enterica subsp. enterica serovar Muenchen]ECG0447009.1 hypothetical protein [Salmonella enterica]ECJ4482631.1 hypothetical protein [Salmonella enterica subsp. diarizonae]EBY3556105.1 hypothetical protein [Salmonella enterica subsp. enterica serovar Muenchen]ECZ0254628.1 hypothetical protein [Salmonella enterica subsp. diarizonae]